MATPVGVTFHVSWSTVMSTALSSMFFIIISSFLVVSPLKICVTAVKLAASLCCPIRQLVTRARATHPRLSRGRPYRTCLPPGKSSADAKDETLTKSNPTSPRDGWYRAPPLWWERYGRDIKKDEWSTRIDPYGDSTSKEVCLGHSPKLLFFTDRPYS